MRYKCINKVCGYRLHNKKFWTCPIKNAPLKCPYCGDELTRYKRPEEQGNDYEIEVRDYIRKRLKNKEKPQKVPGSGCKKGFKGDLYAFPPPINDIVGQCKDTEPTKDEADQWKKTCKDAYVMNRQHPALFKKFFGRHTIRLDLEYFLDLIMELVR